MSHYGPFGRRCFGYTREQIEKPAIYSVQYVTERSGMSEAQLRNLANRRGVKLHRQNNIDFVRRVDIEAKMPELHRLACKREGEDL